MFIKPRLRQKQAWVVDAYVIDVFNEAEAACGVLNAKKQPGGNLDVTVNRSPVILSAQEPDKLWLVLGKLGKQAGEIRSEIGKA
jgi:hypothetical protein